MGSEGFVDAVAEADDHCHLRIVAVEGAEPDR